MKKANKSAIYGFITLAVLTVIFCGMRIFQIAWDVDRITGNLHSSAVNGIVVPITLIIVLITGVVFYFLSPKKSIDTHIIHSIPLGASSLLLSASCLVDGIINYTDAKQSYNTLLTVTDELVSASLQSSARFVCDIALVACIFSVFTAIYFIWLACTYLNKASTKYPSPLLAVFIPLWVGLRLSGDYIQLTNSPVLTETIYDTLTLSALTVFMMSHIRFLSNIQRKNTVRSNFTFGFLSILLALVFPIPRYVMENGFGYTITSGSNLFNLVNFSAALYILLFLIYLENAEESIDTPTGDTVAADTVPTQPNIINTANAEGTIPYDNTAIPPELQSDDGNFDNGINNF